MSAGAAPEVSADATVRVSVIIPVRDRRDLLRAALDALDAQTYRDFEVVVVDDGSRDGSGVAAQARVVAGRPVTVLRQDRHGAVAARTLGVEMSRRELLAFTDSDCAPAPGWLAEAVAAIDDGADLVHGTTRPARAMAPLERSVGSGEDALFPTCNALYRRCAFDAAGGFQDASAQLGFRSGSRARGLGFGEDTLLGWRVKRAGGDVRHVPDALVVHHVFAPDLRDWLSRCAMAAAFPALVAAVPELRATLVRRGFLFGARSRVPCYVTVAAVVAGHKGRGPLVGAALGWWALARLRELRRQPASWPARLAALPQEMVLDAVTGAALVVGSARAGVLLL